MAQPLDGEPPETLAPPEPGNAIDRRPPDLEKRFPMPVTEAERAVDWNAFARQAAFFTSIQHGFRFATEPGTRRGMRGSFWPGYAHSVSNLHGWNDGDAFYVNYVGHPMQGAVSGYIYIQNDPIARRTRFGSDPRYWRGRLRAMGAAWAYSTWFEIGPVSEASLGKIQGRRPQQGFVDHVVTPVIGLGWILAEDFLDEKVILPFERRFENIWLRMMVRGWLNPSRSFANLMRFKEPWYRATRSGITAAEVTTRQLGPAEPREFPKEAPFELTAYPVWTRFNETQCAGGGGQAAFRVSQNWQLVAQVNGCSLRDLAANRSGDQLLYAIGPRWTPQAAKRVSPYAQVLFGGMKLTRYEVDNRKERLLKAEARRAGAEMPAAELYTSQATSNGLALLAGTGVDVRLNPAFAVRLASLEYSRGWAGALDGRSYNQGLQLSTGVILRMGTW